MDKTRILYATSEDYFGSIARDVATSIRLLDRAEFETAVACPVGEAAGEFAAAGATTFDVDMPTKYDPRPVFKLSRILRDWRPQIVHAHTTRAALFSALAARRTASPVVQTEHNWTADLAATDINEQPRFVTRLIHRMLTRGMISRIIVYSTSSADFYLKLNGLDPRRLSMILYCVDPPAPTNPEAIAAKRSALGVPDNALVVGNFGRHDPVKGLPFLLAAIPAVVSACPEAFLCLFGDGTEREALETQAGELGVADRVLFAGWRDDVYDMMALSDIVAVPSLSESAGRIVMEAMAAGTPLVVTSVAALPEYVGDESVALMVPPQDPEALAGALIRLLSDDGLRRKMGAAAHNRYDRTFRPERFVKDLQKIYRDVLAASPPVNDTAKD